MAVPPPLNCPNCRQQRRWGFRNQNNLYRRKCDFSGEDMISLYSQDKLYKVYKEEIWWSDKWDPMDYGRSFDFSRPFFDQFDDLLRSVPRRGMHQDGSNENCEYITFGMSNKNCYLAFACFYCEDVYYSSWLGMAKNCIDCLSCTYCELLYECFYADRCYNCIYCNTCDNCQDSILLEDCKNCNHCICCKNLRNKKYHIYNKSVSKEEFENFREKLLKKDLLNEKEKFDQWKLNFPHENLHIINSENCSGEYIENAKNCHYGYSIVLGAQDCKYCQVAGWKGKDLYDCTMTGKESDLLYEMHATVGSHNCAFTNFCRTCSDTFYCDCVSSCSNCFGCSGLKHKQYCILNKQYSREEYEDLIPRIIQHMGWRAHGASAQAERESGSASLSDAELKNKDFGEFFPLKISPFGYNETLAQIYFPLTREEAIAKGYKWHDEEEDTFLNQTPTEALTCITCGKNYKTIPQELKFYEEREIPIPKNCYKCRLKRREKLRRSQCLHDRNCQKCGIKIKTSYAPDRKEIVYCEKCYLESLN